MFRTNNVSKVIIQGKNTVHPNVKLGLDSLFELVLGLLIRIRAVDNIVNHG